MHCLDDLVEVLEDVPRYVQEGYNRIRMLDEEQEANELKMDHIRGILINQPTSDINKLSDTQREYVFEQLAILLSRMDEIDKEKVCIAETNARVLRLSMKRVHDDLGRVRSDIETENSGATIEIDLKFGQSVDPNNKHDDLSSSRSSLRNRAHYIDDPFQIDEYEDSDESRPITLAPPPRKANKRSTRKSNKRRGRPNRADSFGFGLDDDISSQASSQDNDQLLLEDDDELLDLNDIFPGGISPPSEMTDLLKDDNSLFDDPYLSPAQSPGYVDSPAYSGYDRSREGSVASSSSAGERSATSGNNRQFFTTVSDVSLHGRHRRRTLRAEEMLNDKFERAARRRPNASGYRDDDSNAGSGDDAASNSTPPPQNFEGQLQTAMYMTDGQLDDESDEDAATAWCFCKKPSDGDMIYCENEACRIQWFHFNCVGLDRAPIGRWICPECQAVANANPYFN